MAKLNIVSIKTDTTKVYRPGDSFAFTVVMNVLERIEEDVEFDVIYFCDAYSDHHDQKIESVVIGPIDKGMHTFDIESRPIDFSKIPLKILFGLSCILIAVKYAGQQFLRVGYIVDVKYPGINQDMLLDSDDKPVDGQENDAEEEEEIVEIMEDEELEDDDEEEGSGESEEDDLIDDADEENEAAEGEEELSEGEEELSEGEEEFSEGEGEEDVDHPKTQLEEILTASLLHKNDREPIPLETTIVPGKDDFEFKGMTLQQSKIEMSLLDKPFTHVFEIMWDKKKASEEIIESSDENDKNRDDADECHKKIKIDN